MAAPQLRTIEPHEVRLAQRDPVDTQTLAAAAQIVDDVRGRGEAALREHAERLGDLEAGAPLVLARQALEDAVARLPEEDVAVLERAAERIRQFAEAQLEAIDDMATAVPGGEAGHRVIPHASAGCYAPGGRFPLPSSVLMTAVTAKVAGVKNVWVASPKPADVTLAAAAVAGVEHVLVAGGAQAIAAFAYGAGPVPRCDAVVGPGNRWVTAAKQLVAGRVAIDMLAGPSELVVIADDSADAATVAADLLAQAEHDADALPILITPSADLIAAVNAAIAEQLVELPTRETAAAAVQGGFAVRVADLDAAVQVSDQIAPEHLEVVTANADALAAKLRNYGGLFIGTRSAEVFGDYGVGPNHTLPTSGTARFVGGLSVFNFLRVHTWLRIDDAAADGLIDDAVHLARLEGLEAHARSALRRR
jgi:phosphoribosyl-ATP pyrophosphohydrolase/phosphoribosyl-AMP cyclohydrolase/histidinol dehydrogenase